MSNSTDSHIASLFLDYREKSYGFSEYVLTENGTQLIQDVFEVAKRLFRYYRPKTNGIPPANQQASRLLQQDGSRWIAALRV